MSKSQKLPPWIEVDGPNAVVTVDGIRYGRDMFHALAIWPVGTTFRLDRREPDMVSLVLVSHPDIAVVEQPTAEAA